MNFHPITIIKFNLNQQLRSKMLIVAYCITSLYLVGCAGVKQRLVIPPDEVNSRVILPQRFTSVHSVRVLPLTHEPDIFNFEIAQRSGNLQGLVEKSWRQGSPFIITSEGGEKSEPDAFLKTNIIRYESRVGSDYGALEPARVSFTQTLVGASDSQSIWVARFSHTDRSATDNLLSTATSGWHLAHEVAQAGFIAAAESARAERERYYREHGNSSTVIR
jgi:hypothetical protein